MGGMWGSRASQTRASVSSSVGTTSRGRRYSVISCAARSPSSSCGARSRLGWGEFAWRHLPVGLCLPWLRYSQYMSCPACDRRTWLGVAWFA